MTERNAVELDLATRILLSMAAWLIAGSAAVFGQTSAVPVWQTAAGGKMAFEVASIRPSQPGVFLRPSFPMGSDDSFRPTGGTFQGDFPLWVYILFAYKLNLDEGELLKASLPNWALTDKYAIRARSDQASPTKDQFRLMMQALLADRFQLVLHPETHEVPVLAMTLLVPSHPKPGLRLHAEGPACDVEVTVSANKSPAIYPVHCDEYSAMFLEDNQVLWGSRNTTLQLMTSSMSGIGRLGRPVVDRTGLVGRYDFRMEWTFEPADAVPADAEAGGTTFLEALKEQLGVRLEPTKAPLEVLVVDHVEKPSEN